jgi:6-phosphogluconate dehydrogenase
LWYREGVGYALSSLLVGIAGAIIWSKRKHIGERYSEVIIDTSTDKSTMETVVEAQQTLKGLHEILKIVNITILKIWSLIASRSPKVE